MTAYEPSSQAGLASFTALSWGPGTEPIRGTHRCPAGHPVRIWRAWNDTPRAWCPTCNYELEA